MDNKNIKMLNVIDSRLSLRAKTTSVSGVGQSVRAIHPLGMRVVVRIKNDDNRTNTGLYLPEGSKEKSADSFLGEVVEVASALDELTDELHNISGIPQGALVLISKSAGVKVPWDDSLRIVDTKDVLAIVDEVELS